MNLKQLAKELNLSISTDSISLRGSHEIGVTTKMAVLEKAEKLDHRGDCS